MPAIITVKDLVKNFGPLTAVNHTTFTVDQGEIFAFLGPNGAGKTTTIKMLTTLLHPSHGDIIINGKDVKNNKNGVRSSFGIVFQDQSTDDELTARENMDFHGTLYSVPKKERAARIEELLKMVELWDRRDTLAKTFSGGMKRRLEIARGLLHHPKVLFLDEPTAGLDPQTRNKMWDYLKKLNKTKKITIFFTTHYMEEVEKVAQRVAVIDHGKIIATGTIPELKKKTKTKTLEEAFLKLTGRSIREETPDAMNHLRTHRQLWGGRK